MLAAPAMLCWLQRWVEHSDGMRLPIICWLVEIRYLGQRYIQGVVVSCSPVWSSVKRSC